jgi:hypothetical protein
MPEQDGKSETETRLQQCLAALPQVLKDFERDHPEWRYEVLYWLLDRALKSLRGYLESETETEITWKSPYVEIRFPVDCDWTENPSGEEPSFTLQTGRLTIAEMVDNGTAARALSRLVVRHIEIEALQPPEKPCSHRGASVREP